ncbi:geranylhydroquinone 3''-hydroxylase CYP76B74-like [Rhododendron vialii]|uniref:geranylhydroquinone 3''-hydroxylase CYP76B74-like n=1 Tax=Rhododendron vialii TaxID=182163 RepID=UPI00265FDE56|nr:geranylhydroquinone 3''-hydroxylase CYP76B74-like [Rhododendron vialii]
MISLENGFHPNFNLDPLATLELILQKLVELHLPEKTGVSQVSHNDFRCFTQAFIHHLQPILDMVVGCHQRERRARSSSSYSLNYVTIHIVLPMDISLKSKNQNSAPLPPGPCGLPIVGYLPFLGTNLHQQFAELAHQYGPIYQLWFGNKPCVVLNSPSLAKEVVHDLDTVFADQDPPIAALAATYGGFDIAFAPYGSYWRTMRKVFVREMLSNTSLEDTYSLQRGEVKKTIRDLHSKIGTEVEISEITFLMELNLVMSMLWGGTVDSQRVDSGVEREMKRLLQWVDRIFDPLLESGMSRREGGQENGMKS